MKKIKYLGWFLAVIYIFTGCTAPSAMEPLKRQSELKKIEEPLVSYEDEMYVAANSAGIQLLQKISGEGEEKNAIFSPVSLSTVLAVLENGAAGKTREEINAIINPEQLALGELNEKYCNTINHLNNAGYKENGNRTTLLELANSLWIQEKLPVKDSFLKTSNTYYGAEAHNVNFASSGAKDAMNRWIEDKTHGRIQNHITEVNRQTAMYAFNALYFKGKWQNPFDKSKTQKEEFHLSNGNTVRVDMMNAEGWINYYEDDTIQAGEFNYYGCSMLVVLPKGDTSKYVHQLDYKEIQKLCGNFENMKVKIKFPKFSFQQKNKLDSHLKAMGLASAFDSKNADFTGIASKVEGFNLYIGDISQECFINVDEEGTEAAALTSVALAGAAMPKEIVPPEFYVDKPFAFLIRDDRTGLILFVGKVENPLDSK